MIHQVILFGESNTRITSSCSICSGCSDKESGSCSENTPVITSEELTKSLREAIKNKALENKITVEFRDILKGDLTDFNDVKTLINLSFSFPILTVNKKITYMGPFNPDSMAEEIKETLKL